MNTYRLTRMTAITAAAVLIGACSSGAGSNDPDEGPAQAQKTIRIGTAEESQGPAQEVEGARTGGTIRVYNTSDFAHLDPQKVYSAGDQLVEQLLNRQLTTFAYIDGKAVLVGDLATDTGQVSDGGRTWTYTLKDGLEWEDGEPITAEHVRYGILRSFGQGYEVGPPYFALWLTGTRNITEARAAAPDPQGLDAIETPDDRTVVFHFPQPQSDVPFAASMGTATPVREDRDTGPRYDTQPFSSGPYRIESHKQNSSLTLVANENWDPDTDPARYQFADRYEFTFGQQALNINQRLLAASGPDRTAMTQESLSPQLYDRVSALPNVRDVRTVSSPGFVFYYYLNNKRLTDVNVRKALLYAFPREQVLQVFGGAQYGLPATTITSPSLIGWEDYDLFKVNPRGDVAQAKKFLDQSGVDNLKLSLAYDGTSTSQRAAAQVIKAAYAKIGVSVATKPVDGATYYDVLHVDPSPYDIWWDGWGADWPSPSTVLPVIVDGRQDPFLDPSRYNNDEVNQELDRIAKLPDAEEKAKDLFALEKKVMADAPFIPFAHGVYTQIHGPDLGNVVPNLLGATVRYNGVYVKG